MKAKHSFLRTACQCTLAGIGVGIPTALLLMAIVLVLSTAAGAAQSRDTVSEDTQSFDSPQDAKRGTLMFYGENCLTGAPVLSMQVTMNVYGMIARVHVHQKFKNPDKQWKEGIYVFPLPEHAAVDHMRMTIGERVIEGRIKERGEARKIYTRARDSGKKTSLVEQERPNIFTTSVANIGPGETVAVEIEYQQVVSYDQGEFSLRFPMVVGPRYIPGNLTIDGFTGSGWSPNTDQVEDAARITPPVVHPEMGKINPVSITIDLDAGFRLERVGSPYHTITTENPSGTHYRIRLSRGEVPADRDFVLNWQPAAGTAPRAALFRETFNKKEYALIMLLPPAQGTGTAINRELVFVIDTSGSMGGASIR